MQIGPDTTVAQVVEGLRTAETVFIPLTIGGGVRSVADVSRLLGAGADKVAINTAAVERPVLVQEAVAEFGSQAIVVAIDARKREVSCGDASWEVFVQGGRVPTGLDVVRDALLAAQPSAALKRIRVTFEDAPIGMAIPSSGGRMSAMPSVYQRGPGSRRSGE